MKKLKRDCPELDYIKALAAYANDRGIGSYAEDVIREFGAEVADALLGSVGAESRIRGMRAELLFLSVVASLGQVRMIKEEDGGGAYFSGDTIGMPDFRVVTNAGEQWLVEVVAKAQWGEFYAHG